MPRRPSLTWLPTSVEVGDRVFVPGRDHTRPDVVLAEIERDVVWLIQIPDGDKPGSWKTYAALDSRKDLELYVESYPIPEGWRAVERRTTDVVHFL